MVGFFVNVPLVPSHLIAMSVALAFYYSPLSLACARIMSDFSSAHKVAVRPFFSPPQCFCHARKQWIRKDFLFPSCISEEGKRSYLHACYSCFDLLHNGLHHDKTKFSSANRLQKPKDLAVLEKRGQTERWPSWKKRRRWVKTNTQSVVPLTLKFSIQR